jgi:hypothetical protein
MNNFKIIIVKNNIKQTLIVRDKTTVTDPNNILGSILDDLGLEKVKFTELLPKCKKIKGGDCILEEECTICHENYKLNEFKRQLDCNHFFHKKCIDKWIKDNMNCPMCRKEIDI